MFIYYIITNNLIIYPIDEIVKFVSEWEEEYYPKSKRLGGVSNKSNTTNIANSKSAVQILAERLTNKAREYSIDTKRDSPFALLAKDNDVLWSQGGKPDDTCVVVARLKAV